MEYIENFKDVFIKFANTSKHYLQNLNISGFSGEEPIVFSDIEKNLEFLLDARELTKLLTEHKTNADIFKMYHILGKFYETASTNYELFVKHRIGDIQGTKTSSGYVMTEKYLDGLSSDLSAVSEEFYLIKSKYENPVMVQYLVSLMLNDENHIHECEVLYQDYVHEGQGMHVVNLYIEYLNVVIKKYTGASGSKNIIKNVLRDIEILKTKVLVDDRTTAANNKSCNAIQRMIQRFNLVPDGVDRPLNNLLSELVQSDETNLDNIAKLMSHADKKIGFVVIHKVTSMPLSHNIWTLIDINYLENNKLVQSKTVGVNAVSLRRTETIKTLSGNKNNKNNKSIEFHNDSFADDIASNYYYVMETVDGENYHLLVPWISNVKHVPAVWLEGLDDVNCTPSQRMGAYNHIINGAICEQLREPIIEMQQLTRDEVHREESYWNTLRMAIKREALEYFQERIGHVQVSMKKFDAMLAGNDMCKKIVDLIIEHISIDNLSPYATDFDMLKAELFMSYFRDIDKIQKNIKYDMQEVYRLNHRSKLSGMVPSNIEENQMSMAKHQMVLTLERVIDEVLAKYINRRSNIYMSIDRKVQLINKSFAI
jgi:hypothetical protein